MNQLRDMIAKYGITETQAHKVLKSDLIKGIISYEKHGREVNKLNY